MISQWAAERDFLVHEMRFIVYLFDHAKDGPSNQVERFYVYSMSHGFLIKQDCPWYVIALDFPVCKEKYIYFSNAFLNLELRESVTNVNNMSI